MARIGRSQPIQPFAAHGPDELGAHVQFVLLEDPRWRQPTPPAVVLSGVRGAITQPAPDVPPAPVNLDRVDQRARFLPLPAVVLNQALYTVAPPPPGNPPAPVNVDRVDQRGRYRPLDPQVLSGVLASFVAAPAVLPHGPYVVPFDERRRLLERQPDVQRGFDDVRPPRPQTVEPDLERRRWRPPPDPVLVTGFRAAFFVAPFAPPPRPLVVFSDERLLRKTLQPIVILGHFLSPFVEQFVTGYFQNRPSGQTGSRPSEAVLESAAAGQTDSTPDANPFDSPDPGGVTG